MIQPHEQAVQEEFEQRSHEELWLNTSYGTQEEMPVDVFFREFEDMPELEVLALELCEGKILDVGAGIGAHTLELQNRGKEVTAMEISAPFVNIMKQRGVKNAVVGDIFKPQNEKFDTILLLMNGIGLAGNLQGLKKLLVHFKSMIKPGGQLIFDSSDISYLYEDMPKPDDKYFGELSYQYEYKGRKGDWFDWLYVDEDSLEKIAEETGWKIQLTIEDDYDQYLVKMILAD